MKLTRKDIIDQNNIVGHIVLMSAANAIQQIANELETSPDIEVKLMYGDIELDLEGFIQHWESQIDKMILQKAEELIDEKIDKPLQEMENICRNAVKSIKEKIGIKFDDYY